MGNSPSDAKKSSQAFDTLTDDALVTLKDRPGSTQAEIFKFLEAKYMTKIPLNRKKSIGLRLKAVMERPSRGRYQLRAARNQSAGNYSGSFAPEKRGRRKSKRRRKLHKTPHPSLGNKRLGKKIDRRKKIKRKKPQIIQPFLKDALPGKGPTTRDSKFNAGLSRSNHGLPSRSKTNQSNSKAYYQPGTKKTSRLPGLNSKPYQSNKSKTTSRSHSKAHHLNTKTIQQPTNGSRLVMSQRASAASRSNAKFLKSASNRGKGNDRLKYVSAHERPHKRDREEEESDTENESSDHDEDRRTRSSNRTYSTQGHRQKYSIRRRSVQQHKTEHVASDSEDDNSDDDSEY